jgi:hypothetical protein
MEVIDVIGEYDSTAILESNIGRQPLISVRPVLRGYLVTPNAVTKRISLGIITPITFCEDIPFTSPFFDSVANANQFFFQDSGATVDQWIQRRV